MVYTESPPEAPTPLLDSILLSLPALKLLKLLINAEAVLLILFHLILFYDCKCLMHVPEQHICFLQCQYRQQVSTSSNSQ